jgi:hypothetical protein
MPGDKTRDQQTDDVAGAASAFCARPRALPDADEQAPSLAQLEGSASENAPLGTDPDCAADPPPEVAELAAACVRFVASRYKARLDFTPETLSYVDQWLRDARAELKTRPEALDLVQGAAGAYVGEVIRRAFGARWVIQGGHPEWRLCMSTVYCTYNPIGMAREALLLEPAEGWGAHLELDEGEREDVERRLAALPEANEEEYYASTTRFDVVSIVVACLREGMRERGLVDVRFAPQDYTDR